VFLDGVALGGEKESGIGFCADDVSHFSGLQTVAGIVVGGQHNNFQIGRCPCLADVDEGFVVAYRANGVGDCGSDSLGIDSSDCLTAESVSLSCRLDVRICSERGDYRGADGYRGISGSNDSVGYI